MFATFKKNHPDLFTYQPAAVVHPHDNFIDRFFLRFLSERVTPNKITAWRVILTPVVFGLILREQYLVGTIVFLGVAFTDALDGSLARTRNQITN